MDRWESLHIVAFSGGALFVIGTAAGGFLVAKSRRRTALFIWLIATIGGYAFSMTSMGIGLLTMAFPILLTCLATTVGRNTKVKIAAVITGILYCAGMWWRLPALGSIAPLLSIGCYAIALILRPPLSRTD